MAEESQRLLENLMEGDFWAGYDSQTLTSDDSEYV